MTSWLSFVVSNCEFDIFPLVSWVRCGTWLYRFLIFAPLLTLLPLDGFRHLDPYIRVALEVTLTCMSRDMRFPTMCYVRPAKPQISLRLHAGWSEPLLVAWIFYVCKSTDQTSFADSKAAQAHLSLHLSKCHIVGNHMSRHNYVFFLWIESIVFEQQLTFSLWLRTLWFMTQGGARGPRYRSHLKCGTLSVWLMQMSYKPFLWKQLYPDSLYQSVLQWRIQRGSRRFARTPIPRPSYLKSHENEIIWSHWCLTVSLTFSHWYHWDQIISFSLDI